LIVLISVVSVNHCFRSHLSSPLVTRSSAANSMMAGGLGTSLTMMNEMWKMLIENCLYMKWSLPPVQDHPAVVSLSRKFSVQIKIFYVTFFRILFRKL